MNKQNLKKLLLKIFHFLMPEKNYQIRKLFCFWFYNVQREDAHSLRYNLKLKLTKSLATLNRCYRLIFCEKWRNGKLL